MARSNAKEAYKTLVKTIFPEIGDHVQTASNPRSRAQGGGKGEASILVLLVLVLVV